MGIVPYQKPILFSKVKKYIGHKREAAPHLPVPTFMNSFVATTPSPLPPTPLPVAIAIATPPVATAIASPYYNRVPAISIDVSARIFNFWPAISIDVLVQNCGFHQFSLFRLRFYSIVSESDCGFRSLYGNHYSEHKGFITRFRDFLRLSKYINMLTILCFFR